MDLVEVLFRVCRGGGLGSAGAELPRRYLPPAAASALNEVIETYA